MQYLCLLTFINVVVVQSDYIDCGWFLFVRIYTYVQKHKSFTANTFDPTVAHRSNEGKATH